MRFSGQNNILKNTTGAEHSSAGNVLSRHRGFVLANLMLMVSAFSIWIMWFAVDPILRLPHMIAISAILAPVCVITYLYQTGNYGRANWGFVATLVAFVIILTANLPTSTSQYQPVAIATSLIALVPLLALAQRQNPISYILLSVIGVGTVAMTSSIGWLALVPQLINLFIASVLALVANRSFERSQMQATNAETNISNIIERSGQLLTRHTINGTTLQCSQHSQKMLNLNPKSLLGAGFCNKVHLQDRVALLKTISDAVNLGKETSCEVRIRSKTDAGAQGRKSSVWKWLELRCLPVEFHDASQEPTVSIISTDITKYRSLNEVMPTAELDTNIRAALAQLQPVIAELKVMAEPTTGNQSENEFAVKCRDFLSDVSVVVILAGTSDRPVSYENVSIAGVVDAAIGRWERRVGSVVQVHSGDLLNLPDISNDTEILGHIFDGLIESVVDQSSSGGDLKIDARRFGRSLQITVDISQLPADQITSRSNGSRAIAELTGCREQALQKQILSIGGKLEWSVGESGNVRPVLTLPIQPKNACAVPADEAVKFIRASKRKSNIETSNQGENRARLSA